MCKSCMQLAVSSVGGKEACCAEYNQSNRVKAGVVFNMVIKDVPTLE